eukprot:scaffold228999_cov18-Tisochrysis_lutea.AAC.1
MCKAHVAEEFSERTVTKVSLTFVTPGAATHRCLQASICHCVCTCKAHVAEDGNDCILESRLLVLLLTDAYKRGSVGTHISQSHACKQKVMHSKRGFRQSSMLTFAACTARYSHGRHGRLSPIPSQALTSLDPGAFLLPRLALYLPKHSQAQTNVHSCHLCL